MTAGVSTSKIKVGGTVEGGRGHQLDRFWVRIGYCYMVIRDVKSIIKQPPDRGNR